MRVSQQENGVLLLLGDVLGMIISLFAAFLIGYKGNIDTATFLMYSTSIVSIFCSIVLIFFTLDIYTLRKLPENLWDQATMIGIGLLLSALLTTFIFFFFKNPMPRAVFILFYLFSSLPIFSTRILLRRIRLSSVHQKILLVGDAKLCENMAQLIHSRKYLHARVIGYICPEGASGGTDALPCLGGVNELLPVTRKDKVDQIVVATSFIGGELNKVLLECMKEKARISDYWRKIEDVTGKVPIDYLDDYWFTVSLSHIDKRYFWMVKRLFDIVTSSLGLVIVLPLFLFAAFLVKLDSRGPVLYSQVRIGKANRPFRLWKIRTMRVGADKNNVHWTLENDERITGMGKLLRKMRFDEAPQLFNILLGNMTLVGPRPEAASLVELYGSEIPYYSERHMVTPGITGWAQINYRYGNTVADAREKLMYDLYYIKHRSIALDAAIILKTIRIVLTGQGAM
jgi:exopolysaccharide biosynthesis polyprenyl glycosylphosphotransferase